MIKYYSGYFKCGETVIVNEQNAGSCSFVLTAYRHKVKKLLSCHLVKITIDDPYILQNGIVVLI